MQEGGPPFLLRVVIGQVDVRIAAHTASVALPVVELLSGFAATPTIAPLFKSANKRVDGRHDSLTGGCRITTAKLNTTLLVTQVAHTPCQRRTRL
jgi:hypothetical protein